jgi:hypothetical protein
LKAPCESEGLSTKNFSNMNYPSEVMEIHNKFNTASDKLLKKAEDILAKQVEENGEKIDRLKSFGFTKTKDNTAKEDDKKEKQYQQKLVEAINFYHLKFPNFKFIPEKQAEKICKKYHLVLGGVEQYKGFVPDKNLHDIERFFEQHPEARYTYTKQGGDSTGQGLIWHLTNGETSATKEEYDAYMHKESVEKLAKLGIEATKPETKAYKSVFDVKAIDNQIQTLQQATPDSPFSAGEQDRLHWYESPARGYGRTSYHDQYMQSVADMYKMYMPSYIAKGGSRKETVSRKEAKLKICAPIADMNTQGYEVKEGWKLVYDPIVSLSVTHANGITGLIIITAWGDEASDELVLNHNQN